MSKAAAPAQKWNRVREVVTPEGVPLHFVVARGGERSVAFIIDVLIVLALCLSIQLIAYFVAQDTPALEGLFIFAFFGTRNFYFPLFEIRWQGRTVGKRVMGLRVIDAEGGPLRTNAILTRNLFREIEFWKPFLILFTVENVGLAHSDVWLPALLFFLVFTFVPLVNRNRQRVGDLVAGTLLVRNPREALLVDLGAQEMRRRQKVQARYAFTPEQLQVYGEFELQVLEDVLRKTNSAERSKALRVISEKVRRKIRWKGGKVEHERFLREFYAAQRAHLEKGMLFGQRKKDKHARN